MFGLLVRVSIAALLVLWLFRHAGGFAPVAAAARAARFDRIALALLTTIAVQATIAYRLRGLTHAQRMMFGAGELLELNLVTLFYGLFLPGGGLTAIMIRFYRLTRGDGRYTATLAALVCDRLLATATMSAIGLLFWLLDGPERSHPAVIVLAFATLASAVALAPMLNAAPERWIGRLVVRLPLIGGVWSRVTGAFAVFRELPARVQLSLAGFSFAAQILGVVVYLLLARSLGIATSFAALGWMRSTATLIAILPFSISGLGLREGTLVHLLGARGVPGHAAVAFSFLVFGVSILFVGMLGGLLEALRWLRPRRARAAGSPR